MTKMKEIKKMSDKDIIELVKDKREASRGVRFGSGTRDTHTSKNARKEVARALTELTTRQTASNAQAGNKEAK